MRASGERAMAMFAHSPFALLLFFLPFYPPPFFVSDLQQHYGENNVVGEAPGLDPVCSEMNEGQMG